MIRLFSAALFIGAIFLGGCSEPPKIEETPTSKMIERVMEAKRRFRALPDIKPEQNMKKIEMQRDYFTPLDLEKTGKNFEGALTPESIDKMTKLLDEADKQMDKFPK